MLLWLCQQAEWNGTDTFSMPNLSHWFQTMIVVPSIRFVCAFEIIAALYSTSVLFLLYSLRKRKAYALCRFRFQWMNLLIHLTDNLCSIRHHFFLERPYIVFTVFNKTTFPFCRLFGAWMMFKIGRELVLFDIPTEHGWHIFPIYNHMIKHLVIWKLSPLQRTFGNCINQQRAARAYMVYIGFRNAEIVCIDEWVCMEYCLHAPIR